MNYQKVRQEVISVFLLFVIVVMVIIRMLVIGNLFLLLMYIRNQSLKGKSSA